MGLARDDVAWRGYGVGLAGKWRALWVLGSRVRGNDVGWCSIAWWGVDLVVVGCLDSVYWLTARATC